ncbi:hypothetical protein Tco_0872137 [Tanacetum coccineum]
MTSCGGNGCGEVTSARRGLGGGDWDWGREVERKCSRSVCVESGKPLDVRRRVSQLDDDDDDDDVTVVMIDNGDESLKRTSNEWERKRGAPRQQCEVGTSSASGMVARRGPLKHTVVIRSTRAGKEGITMEQPSEQRLTNSAGNHSLMAGGAWAQPSQGLTQNARDPYGLAKNGRRANGYTNQTQDLEELATQTGAGGDGCPKRARLDTREDQDAHDDVLHTKRTGVDWKNPSGKTKTKLVNGHYETIRIFPSSRKASITTRRGCTSHITLACNSIIYPAVQYRGAISIREVVSNEVEVT